MVAKLAAPHFSHQFLPRGVSADAAARWCRHVTCTLLPFFKPHQLNPCMHFFPSRVFLIVLVRSSIVFLWFRNCRSPISSAVFICTLLPLLLDGSRTLSRASLAFVAEQQHWRRALKHLSHLVSTRIYTLNADNAEGTTRFVEISSTKWISFRAKRHSEHHYSGDNGGGGEDEMRLSRNLLLVFPIPIGSVSADAKADFSWLQLKY